MALAFRYYIFPDDAPQRLPKKRLEALISGRERMPQFAGTRQKNAEVVLEVDGRRPVQIVRAMGSFFHFDQEGSLHSLAESAIDLLDMHHNLAKAKETSPTNIIDLAPELRQRKWQRQHRWHLSNEQLDLIVKDLWKK